MKNISFEPTTPAQSFSEIRELMSYQDVADALNAEVKHEFIFVNAEFDGFITVKMDDIEIWAKSVNLSIFRNDNFSRLVNFRNDNYSNLVKKSFTFHLNGNLSGYSYETERDALTKAFIQHYWLPLERQNEKTRCSYQLITANS